MANKATSSSWQLYLTLCKPKVVVLILITTLVGMCLASPTVPTYHLIVSTLLGIGCMASAAAVINHLADQQADRLMQRTQHRPIASGQVTSKQALIFAMMLLSLGLTILIYYVNTLTAWLTFLTLVGYAGIYTYYLKRATHQNIVIGGLAGAFPPCLGWTAVHAELHPYALLLVLIVFVWTPPHFWALAIHRHQDYQNANIPMLTVTHGIQITKLSIVLYTILLLLATLLPYLTGMSGALYLIAALSLGGRFLYLSIVLYRTPMKKAALTTFRYSISYLFLLYLALLIDHYAQ